MSKDVIPLMLFVAQEGRCFHCQSEFVGKGGPGKHNKHKHWTRDHVKLASQGHGRAKNVVLACGSCNKLRGARPATADEMMRADEIFKKVHTIWTAFYGDSMPVWAADPRHNAEIPVPQAAE